MAAGCRRRRQEPRDAVHGDHRRARIEQLPQGPEPVAVEHRPREARHALPDVKASRYARTAATRVLMPSSGWRSSWARINDMDDSIVRMPTLSSSATFWFDIPVATSEGTRNYRSVSRPIGPSVSIRAPARSRPSIVISPAAAPRSAVPS